MYRVRPQITISPSISIIEGYPHILETLAVTLMAKGVKTVAFETYPTIPVEDFVTALKEAFPEAMVEPTEDYYVSKGKLFKALEDDLTEDEVFGRFSHKTFTDFLDPLKLKDLYDKRRTHQGLYFLIGVGAATMIDYDALVYLDLNRWEIQKNFKKGGANWQGFREISFMEKLKRAYYFEWPAATEGKKYSLNQLDYYIDMNCPENPRMISGSDLWASLAEVVSKPLRLVPFFEEGIWGGHWMQEHFGVGQEVINLAWCFDGVPEENSLLLTNGTQELEMPAENLVLMYPKALMGERVFGRYGSDFPIRFNLLDTVGGQNLSLQVHPTLDYAYRNFGAKYTQDESYFVIDTTERACVYLGVKEGVDKTDLVDAFEQAQVTGTFEDDRYIHSLPVKQFDHYLIPGGTIHSSGAGSIVLEISSTPNRFTFKLWDWGRVDLDGKPRPISLHHGRHVINTDFDSTRVNRELYNQHRLTHEEEGFKEEKTGLHPLEAIETRLLTFSKPIQQACMGSVNVLNLVKGAHLQVTALDQSFEPFDVYYGETFIIPESVKEYQLVPADSENEVKVMKAFIR